MSIRIELLLVACAMIIMHLAADESVQPQIRRPTLESWFGTAPRIDGIITPGELEDATEIRGVREWTAEFSRVTEDSDLALKGWVKHDAEWLYFGFEITDDLPQYPEYAPMT